MLTQDEVEKLIKSYIEATETLGELTGGSGHHAFVSYNLLDFKFEQIPNKQWKLIFRFIISIETEFTYEPDNPPKQTEYEKELILDDNYEVISGKSLSEKSNWLNDELLDPSWQDNKEKILIFIEKMLMKIEWLYGENRAPIKYPPQFLEDKGKYICKIELEDGVGELIYEAMQSSLLYEEVINDLKQRYMSNL